MSSKKTTKKGKKESKELSVDTPKKLTQTNIKDLETAFKIFDKNSDGRISKDEIGNVLADNDIQFSPTQLDSFMKKLDKDGDGEVDYGEFCGLMKDLVESAVVLEGELQEAFSKIDVDGDGRVSADELREAVMRLGENLTEKEADDIVHAVDDNGDAHLDYDEFVTLMFMLNICSPNE